MTTNKTTYYNIFYEQYFPLKIHMLNCDVYSLLKGIAADKKKKIKYVVQIIILNNHYNLYQLE